VNSVKRRAPNITVPVAKARIFLTATGHTREQAKAPSRRGGRETDDLGL